MALSMPTEIQTERKKVGHHPIIMIEITGKSIYLASEQYTLDLTAGGTQTFDDYIKEKSTIKINTRIPETFGSLASKATLSITLVDWSHFKGTLIGTGTDADLTDEPIEVYLKFKTSNADEANRILLFSGFVDTYSEVAGTLKLNAGGFYFNKYDPIPLQLLLDYDSESVNDDDVCIPLQYGDFSWNDDLRFWDDTEIKLATCPLLKRDTANKVFKFMVANHTMHNLPTATDFQDVKNFKAFIKRNGQYLPVGMTSVSVNTTTPVNIQAGSIAPYYMLIPINLYTLDPDYDNITNAEYTIDGKQSTLVDLASADPSTYGVIVHDFDINTISDDFQGTGITVMANVDVSGSSGSVVYFRMRLRKKSDDSIVDTYEITSNVSGWINYTFDIDPAQINSYYIELTSSSYADTCDIYDIIVLVRATSYNIDQDEKAIYIVAQGREFSGTWDSRRTSGDLIQHPVDMIESLVRDEMSITDIDTDSLDAVKALHTWSVNASIYRQMDADQLFQEIAQAFNYGIGFRPVGSFFISYPYAFNFSQSGIGTPSDDDIITDSETIQNDSFDKVPIVRDSLNMARTLASDKKTKTIVQYGLDFSNNFTRQSSNGSGSWVFIIQNPFIQNSNTGDSIALALTSFRSKQRYLINVETFFDLIWIELGDIVNIRHTDLPSTFLSDVQNSQKWAIISTSLDLLAGKVKIKALEL